MSTNSATNLGGRNCPVTFERWDCPICEETGKKVVQTANEGTANNTGAEKALRLHLRSSTGNGHGSKNTYPSGYGSHVDLSSYTY